MPVDPTISLAAGGGAGSAVPQQAPAQAIDTWSQAVNRINQNQLFQQTFAARQRAGQIMSAAPDLESGWTAMMKDPLVAPFAGAIVNEGRQAQKALLDIHGETSKQAMTGLEGAMKALSAGYADPSMISPMLKLHLDGLGPEARKVAAPLFDSLATSLGDGLPAGEAGITKLRSRITGIMAASGLNDAVIRGVTGTLAPEVRSGPFGPGGAERTYSIGGSYTPGLVGPGGSLPGAGGGPVPGGSGGPGGAAASLPGGALSLPSGSPAGGGIGLSAAATGASGGGGAASAAPPSAPPPAGASYDPGLSGVSVGQHSYLQDRYKNLAQDQSRLDQDVTSQSMIQQVLQEARGAMTQFKPGGGAGVYARLGATAQAFGAPQELVDKISNGNLAATQEFQKLMVNNVMAQIKSQLPSGSRLAQYEFRVFEDRNPNISTDPRAIEKIFGWWDKLYARSTDEQSSLNKYLANNGDLSAWPAEWQRQAKAKGYITPGSALGSGAATAEPAGALAGGYATKEDVIRAYDGGKGHLSRAHAMEILKSKGWAE